jgi:hypothetical protein
MKRDRATAVTHPAVFCKATANFNDIRAAVEGCNPEHTAGAALTFDAVTN